MAGCPQPGLRALLDLALPGGSPAPPHRPVPERPEGHWGLWILLRMAVPLEVLEAPYQSLGGSLGWHFQPPRAWAQRSLHLPYVTPHSSRGARRLLPAPGKRKGPCSIAISTSRPQLSEENYLSWQEERRRDFLEQLAEPALEERLTKNPGSDPLTLMPSCLPNDLDTIKLMET